MDAPEIVNKLLTPGAEHGRTGQKLTPQGLVIHYVGNPGSSALANRNWFEAGAGGAYTSAHYIVGLAGEIIRCIPDNERAMHAGKSYGSKWDATAKYNNGKYIGIENCHPRADGQFNAATYASLIQLTVWLCALYGFNEGNIFRHYDVSGKMCPLYYVKNPEAWKKLKGDIVSAQEQASNEPSAWAKEAWDWAMKNKITDGSDPQGAATREQVICLIYRARAIKT